MRLHRFWIVLLLASCAARPDYLSGNEIRVALGGHTATLPGGFVEYYAPDGTVHGISEGQPYQGLWTIDRDRFCTALSGDPPVCSPVARNGTALMWSIDGERRLSRVDRIEPGNPRGL